MEDKVLELIGKLSFESQSAVEAVKYWVTWMYIFGAFKIITITTTIILIARYLWKATDRMFEKD